MLADQLRLMPPVELKRHMQALADAGYTVVEHFMSEDLVVLLKKRVEDLSSTASPRPSHPADDLGTTPDNAKKDLLVWNLQNKDKIFIDLMSCPQLAAILMPILNDPFFTAIPQNEPNYILSYCNARSSVIQMPLHTDVYLPVEGNRTWGMQTIFALDHQLIESGCMVCVPGSHVRGQYISAPFEAAQPVESHAGDLVIFSSRLWHGARANSSAQTRWGILGSFRMWWVKQLADMPRGLPDAIYQQLTASQKALLGYCSIPPLNENERIQTKTGYASLRPHVRDYYPPLA